MKKITFREFDGSAYIIFNRDGSTFINNFSYHNELTNGKLDVLEFKAYYYNGRLKKQHAPFIGWWRAADTDEHSKTYFKEDDVFDHIFLQYIERAQDQLQVTDEPITEDDPITEEQHELLKRLTKK